MEQGHYAEALGAYQKLVKQYPEGGVWGEYSRAATIAGDFELAERIWEKMRSLGPPTADLLGKLAREYQGIKFHAKARELYEEAARIEPQNLDAQIDLAAMLARTGSVADARP